MADKVGGFLEVGCNDDDEIVVCGAYVFAFLKQEFLRIHALRFLNPSASASKNRRACARRAFVS